MLIYTLRFPVDEGLSFYQICREIMLLEQKGVTEHEIELSLSQGQLSVLKPVMELIFPPMDTLPPGIIGYFAEIPIRLLEF